MTYLKSIVDSSSSEINRLAERAVFAIAFDDDARVDSMLTEMIQRPIEEPLRSRAIYWLGNTPEAATKNAIFSDIVRDTKSGQVEIQKQAVIAISRRPKEEAIPILIRTARNHARMEVRKQAIQVLGQTGDERAVAFWRTVKQINATDVK